MKKTYFFLFAVSFCFVSCGSNSDQKPFSAEEAVRVVEELDSTTQVLDAVKEEIDLSTKDLDNLLNDLN